MPHVRCPSWSVGSCNVPLILFACEFPVGRSTPNPTTMRLRNDGRKLYFVLTRISPIPASWKASYSPSPVGGLPYKHIKHTHIIERGSPPTGEGANIPNPRVLEGLILNLPGGGAPPFYIVC